MYVDNTNMAQRHFGGLTKTEVLPPRGQFKGKASRAQVNKKLAIQPKPLPPHFSCWLFHTGSILQSGLLIHIMFYVLL